MPALGKRVDTPDLVWDYATIGCVEPGIPGISYNSSDAVLFNYAADKLAAVAQWFKQRGIAPVEA